MNMRQIVLSAALLSAGSLFGADVVTPEGKDMIRQAQLSRQESQHRGDFLVREGHKLFEALLGREKRVKKEGQRRTDKERYANVKRRMHTEVHT